MKALSRHIQAITTSQFPEMEDKKLCASLLKKYFKHIHRNFKNKTDTDHSHTNIFQSLHFTFPIIFIHIMLTMYQSECISTNTSPSNQTDNNQFVIMYEKIPPSGNSFASNSD